MFNINKGIDFSSTTSNKVNRPRCKDPAIPLVGMNRCFQDYGSTGKRFIYKNVGFRLARRKELFYRRKIIADCALVFALLGIALMICEIELCMAEIILKNGIGSLLIKASVTLTTVILLGFTAWYHYLDIKVFLIDNNIDDWYLAVDISRVLQISVELLICMIHPLPANFDANFMWPIFDKENQLWLDNKQVPMDVLLSLPMFLRCYLTCRVLRLHSKLFQDASSQSLGALNRIRFNFCFIFKSWMNVYPEHVLSILILVVFICASWAYRACEMYFGKEQRNFLNSMWLIAITFLSVGYGDITPMSYCGRAIAVITASFGALCTALTVAVLIRKLELSRAEKYVHNFVMDAKLSKKLKHAASNIVKEGWLVYKCRTLHRPSEQFVHQRRLLKAIHRVHEIKDTQRRLLDNSVNLIQVYKNPNEEMLKIENIAQCCAELKNRLITIERKIDTLLLKE